MAINSEDSSAPHAPGYGMTTSLPEPGFHSQECMPQSLDHNPFHTSMDTSSEKPSPLNLAHGGPDTPTTAAPDSNDRLMTAAQPVTKSQPDYNAIPGPLGPAASSLENKVALITGAARGIGREVAMELARRGAHLVLAYSSSTEAIITLQHAIQIECPASQVLTVQTDVTSVPSIVDLFSTAVRHFNAPLDIVVSNSGICSFSHTSDVTEEEFDRVFAVNTRGQFFVAREAHKHLRQGGRLILMGSITGQAKAVPRHAVYSGSKGAIESFVRCMAVDFGDKKITVNAIAPGGVKTDMYHAVCREYIPGGDQLDNEQVDEYAAGWSPMHRVGLPIDIARIVCFLASQDGGWINGKVIGADGGACM